ncbi:hypothetical protein DPEC_G00072730 [Dallia pectoralis]|uniref:Uncharacterized protein n=1 Tax=Dallia pectoralis TaxID=75939 RepID=A0ACC2H2S8_DALPE|nr:hypothetical protein DPEC_G00072730 [Dallia pectoralis]
MFHQERPNNQDITHNTASVWDGGGTYPSVHLGRRARGFVSHLERPAIRTIPWYRSCSLRLMQSVKNRCQHLSNGKCLFYTECQRSHNLLINRMKQSVEWRAGGAERVGKEIVR